MPELNDFNLDKFVSNNERNVNSGFEIVRGESK